MVYDYFDKYTFLCDMYDAEADAIVELALNYFPFDNSCQVINTKKGKNLLKRVQMPSLKPEMLQIGNIVNIFSKLLLIRDCAPATRRTLFNKVESTFAMIKPVHPSKHGKIITFIMKKGFRIVRMKNGKVSKDFAMDLYKSIAGNSVLPIIIDYVTSGEVIGLELVGPNAVQEWRRCLGATDPLDAAPGTLRQIYGENKLRNIAHGCNTLEDANEKFGIERRGPKVFLIYRKPHYELTKGDQIPKPAVDTAIRSQPGRLFPHDIGEQAKMTKGFVDRSDVLICHNSTLQMLELYFGHENGVQRIPFRATFKDCTCCVIKPHAVIDGNVGAILEQISTSGQFYISAMAMFSVKLANSEEFYEVYKGVLPEYEAMCIHLAEGKCIALEVKCSDPSMNCVCEFRKLCGPRDPDLCRQLYPDSIRALYGKTIVHNAVHCTDLAEDGENEVEYFFKLLAND